jgi:uncharacterized protein (DUF2164 family)
MMNPAMLGLGFLAIASPIIIHLLNRRRFKIIDWAAMEFLLDANRKNRRRIKLENLILLLLRCLAMLLIGFLLARPFLSSALAIFGEQPVERIVLLDDSLSMSLQNGNSTVFEAAKQNLETTLRSVAAENRGDLLTLFLTSNPQSPVFANKPINNDTQNEFSDELKLLKPSDKTASMENALQEVKQFISGLKKNSDRLVYVITDLRDYDWRDDATEVDENSARNLLKSISEQVTSCFLVDAGVKDSANLVITRIRPEEGLRSGVASRFEVTVANQGQQTVDQVRVRFQVGKEGVEDEEFIESIPAGEERTVFFNFNKTIEDPGLEELAPGETPAVIGDVQSLPVTARVLPADPEEDRLLADSEAFFAARVLRGNPVLIVNGDPSLDPVQSESHYLARAVDPPEIVSGNLLEVTTYTKFETTTLSQYRVIFLCNVDEISEDQQIKLEKWVRDGGGLVIMPGDRIIADVYNKQFYNQGKGLSPVQLTETMGDVDESRWAHFSIPEAVHPIIGIFEGQNNPLIDSVKIFNWWGNKIDPAQDGKTIQRIASLNDDLETPAIVEKSFGKGRVIFTAIPADLDWTDWPNSPSYLVAVQEMIRYLVGDEVEASELQIGQRLQVPLDLSLFRRDASIRDSSNEKYSVQAVPDEVGADAASTVWNIRFDDANRRGFYDLSLTRTSDASQESLLFAANIDPREGNLRPLDKASIGNDYFGEKTKLVGSEEMSSQTVSANQNEFWRYLLYILGAVLGIELVLGWIFGRRRS